MLDILNLESLEPRARERLDPMLFDYIAGGADDEWTLAENRAAWSRLQLLPRMLRGVANRSLDTTVLGTRVSFPVLVPPMNHARWGDRVPPLVPAPPLSDRPTLRNRNRDAVKSLATRV